MNNKKLDNAILNKFKVKSNLVDFINSAYKPVLPDFIKDETKSDNENTVCEEYERLVFFITKTRNVFILLKHAFKTLADKEMPKSSVGLHLFFSSHEIKDDIKEALKNVFIFPYFKLLRSISEIPNHTEYNYLGDVDSIELEKYLIEFDVPVKKYISLLLKEDSKLKESVVIPE